MFECLIDVADSLQGVIERGSSNASKPFLIKVLRFRSLLEAGSWPPRRALLTDKISSTIERGKKGKSKSVQQNVWIPSRSASPLNTACLTTDYFPVCFLLRSYCLSGLGQPSRGLEDESFLLHWKACIHSTTCVINFLTESSEDRKLKIQ